MASECLDFIFIYTSFLKKKKKIKKENKHFKKEGCEIDLSYVNSEPSKKKKISGQKHEEHF